MVEQPLGIPETFDAHARLMYDLLALAYQCDLTRVGTFMIGKEVSGRSYPEIGVPDGHHACSHHQNDPAKLEKLAKINRYHMQHFAYFLEKLRKTPDGDGSLLDHSIFVYGSGISDGNIHFHLDLPMVVVGGGAGTLRAAGTCATATTRRSRTCMCRCSTSWGCRWTSSATAPASSIPWRISSRNVGRTSQVSRLLGGPLGPPRAGPTRRSPDLRGPAYSCGFAHVKQ